jgi:hypothetical protein
MRFGGTTLPTRDIVKTYCAIEKSLRGAAVNVIYGA